MRHIFFKIEAERAAYNDSTTQKMRAIPEINVTPYSTELVLMRPPSCGLSPNYTMIASLWFIMTWPIFITWLISWPTSWLIAKLCVKKAEPEDEDEPVREPEPEPVPEPLDLSGPICDLLREGSFTARDLLLELRDQADAGCLTSDGSPTTITKHDVISCLYSLKAKSIVTVTRRTKKSPVWSLVGADSTFTLYELSAFDYPLEDPEYAANSRGDVVNSRWEYAGHFDFKTRVHNPFVRKPADWKRIV
jgi:hypothetical protein